MISASKRIASWHSINITRTRILNMTNFMVVAVQVEANLLEELSVHLYFRKLNVAKNVRYLKSFHMLSELAPTMSEILKLKISNLFTLANFQLFKSRSVHFFASSHRFRHKYLNFFNFQKVGQSTIFAITPIDGKCQNLQMSPTHFCATLTVSQIKINKKFGPSKSRSRSRSEIFTITPFDGKCQICKCLPLIFTLDLTVSEIYHYIIFKK